MVADPDSFLPLTPRVFHILLALADRPEHGYNIMKEVEERSEGRVTIGPGTLYEAIHTLHRRGLIEETDDRPDDDDRRRRYYVLTALGRDVMDAETDRLAAVVELARSKQAVRR